LRKQIYCAICFAILIPIVSASVVFADELTTEDADFLIRSVASEYEDMPYAARAGVIAVIMNRVEAEEYPDTAAGVISTYRNEDGSLRFNERSLMTSEKALRMTRDAYVGVMNGADVTEGALNFEFIKGLSRKLDFDFDDRSEDEHARELAMQCRKYKLVIDGVGFW